MSCDAISTDGTLANGVCFLKLNFAAFTDVSKDPPFHANFMRNDTLLEV